MGQRSEPSPFSQHETKKHERTPWLKNVNPVERKPDVIILLRPPLRPLPVIRELALHEKPWVRVEPARRHQDLQVPVGPKLRKCADQAVTRFDNPTHVLHIRECHDDNHTGRLEGVGEDPGEGQEEVVAAAGNASGEQQEKINELESSRKKNKFWERI